MRGTAGADSQVVKRTERSVAYSVTDRDGKRHDLALHYGEDGSMWFTRRGGDARVSSVFWGPLSVRGWMIKHGLTPVGSASPDWQRLLREEEERQAILGDAA